MEKKVRVKIEYCLLDGTKVQKTKILPTLRISDTFPTQFNVGDFVSQSKGQPPGMFLISEAIVEEKRLVLNEVDCAPIHWKGDKNGKGHGPDDYCTKKKCPHLSQCPISAHIMMMADID